MIGWLGMILMFLGFFLTLSSEYQEPRRQKILRLGLVFVSAGMALIILGWYAQ